MRRQAVAGPQQLWAEGMSAASVTNAISTPASGLLGACLWLNVSLYLKSPQSL